MALSKESKLELIRENLAEVLNPEIINEVLNKDETLRIYWGIFFFILFFLIFFFYDFYCGFWCGIWIVEFG